MTAVVAWMLGVMLLEGPDEPALDRATAARIAAEADAGLSEAPVRATGARDESVTITSERSDFDREARVALFDRGVCVDYAGSYQLRADRVFAFMDAKNQLSRIVALGNVAITNETRSGACEMATFRRGVGEIEMHGRAEALARLEDGGANRILGRRIKFWLDSEQVEIVGSEIVVDKGKGDLKLL